MKKLLNLDDIRLERNVLLHLQAHCAEHELDPANLYIYYKDDKLHVGFGDSSKYDITLNDAHWLPAKSDVSRDLTVLN